MVVSLKSRSIEAGLAVTRSRAAEKWLRGRGAGHVLFKICSTFDSTDAGNIGPVMDALRADSGDAIVLVTPAFPGDRPHRLSGQSVRRLGAAERKPAEGSSAQPDARFQSGAGAGAAEQDQDRPGRSRRHSRAAPDAVRARLADLAGQGHRRRHRRCRVRPRSRNHRRGGAGSSALGRRLRHRARARARAGGLRQGQVECAERGCRCARSADRRHVSPAVARRRRCSRSPTPKRSCRCCISIPTSVVAGKEEARRALAWARERLGEGPVLIASSSTPEQVAALQSRHGRDAAGHAIEQAMADIAEGLVQSGVRRLVVAGGETSGAVVDRLEHSRLSGRRGNRCRRAGSARGRRQRAARCCLR